MTTKFSMLQIMNAALVSQGEYEVANNDGTDEWRLLFRNWAPIVEAELEDGEYHFTRQQVELITRTNGKYGFDDGFLVPDTALHVRRVWVNDQEGKPQDVDWVQDSSYVYLNNPDGCMAEIITSEETDLWSANFVRGVQMKLEAAILRNKEEYGEAGQMENQAETYFQRARTRSSKSRAPRQIYKSGPIARARHRRGTY